MVDLAIARNFHLEPLRERVGALRTHAVETAGIFVGALSEFSAGVQVRQHELDRRHFPFRMNINRNATPIIAD